MRTVNRVLAVVLAICVMFVAVLIAVELVAERLDAGSLIINWHTIYNWLNTRTWNSTSVRIVAGLCTLGGLLLLASQLVPRRKQRLPAHGGAPATDVRIDRKGVVRTVQQAVGDIEGITRARVALRRNKVTVDARRRAEKAEGVDTQTVADATHRAVDGLHLRRPPRISIKLDTAKER